MKRRQSIYANRRSVGRSFSATRLSVGRTVSETKRSLGWSVFATGRSVGQSPSAIRRFALYCRCLQSNQVLDSLVLLEGLVSTSPKKPFANLQKYRKFEDLSSFYKTVFAIKRVLMCCCVSYTSKKSPKETQIVTNSSSFIVNPIPTYIRQHQESYIELFHPQFSYA